ncbi:MAG: tetratricopeptide repeat protein [Opitutales bacterium]
MSDSKSQPPAKDDQAKQSDAPADKPAKPASGGRGPDERNLVEVDEAFAQASFDDRLWLWWQRNGKALLTGAAVALIAAGLVQAFRMFERQQFESMQAEYAEAVGDSEALRAFGREHSGTSLGGAALLKVADETFQEGNYAEAANLYQQAAASLEGLPLATRATMAQAFALIEQGDTRVQAGYALLAQVAETSGNLPSLRAEAAFHRGVLATEAEDYATARRFFDLAVEQDQSGVWRQQVQQIERAVPELRADDGQAGDEMATDEAAESSLDEMSGETGS